jgi:hypothetical protein
MTRVSLVPALAAILMCGSKAHAADPLRAEFCAVVQQPERFAGKVIEVRALQTRLKHGAWGLMGDCWPPMLLVLPKDVAPPPDFAVEESPAFTQLMTARDERVSFKATFVGRFDWSSARSASRPGKARPFGRSKLTMRLVLQNVSDPQRIVLPYK